MLQLKVCGLTKLDQIQELINLNINYLGFIFYEKSPRHVLNALSLDQIFHIQSQQKIGVFVNESIEKIIKIAEKAGLNFIQLHGDETENYVSDLRTALDDKIKIVKVFRIGNEIENVQNAINNLKSTVDYFLFDTDSKYYGGTGHSFNWQILNDLEIEKPYFLSGGISEANIQKLEILKEKPFALDINSKFEHEPGNKDVNRIAALKEYLSREATI